MNIELDPNTRKKISDYIAIIFFILVAISCVFEVVKRVDDALVEIGLIALLLVADFLVSCLLSILTDKALDVNRDITEGIVLGKEITEEVHENHHTYLPLMVGKCIVPMPYNYREDKEMKYFLKIKADDGLIEKVEVSKDKFEEAKFLKKIIL